MNFPPHPEPNKVLALTVYTEHGDTTVRGYLMDLLAAVWREKEDFSAKRPWGNSGWHYELYAPLFREGLISGSVDDEGDFVELDTEKGDELIADAIRYMHDAHLSTPWII